MATSITDQPKKHNEVDEFNISKYEDGLTTFIQSASTPLTIALQGEWGSGKTSLMETLKYRLCDAPGARFKGIWINTWEYSLMSNTETTLAKILYQIISEIDKINNNSNLTKNIKETGGKILKACLRTTLGFVANGDSSGVDELFAPNDSSIGDLRKETESNIKEIINKDKDCKGIIFFIDDLDRINPSSAVQLMELMKNIFTLEHCIFILAIDYDVVVKGLKPKFGELTDKNEHEFRQFFDKIIQVPFSMPVTNYEVSEFVKNALINVGYFDENESTINEYKNDILNLIKYSVGYNPRSIKRLINSTSLVKCIHGDSESMKDTNTKFLNLAFIALQVVYPKIYNLLLKQAEFTKWHDKKFLLENNFKELDAEYIEKLGGLTKLEIANDPWEQALKMICESDNFLDKHFSEISSILNLIRKRAPFDEKDSTSLDVTLIEEILKLSMTTNTTSTFEGSSAQSGLKIMDNVYDKLSKSLVNGITLNKLESTDRDISLDIEYFSEKIRAIIDTKKSGAEYLLNLKVFDDKNHLIGQSNVDEMNKLKKNLEDSLNTSHKGTRYAVDRVRPNATSGQYVIPGVKIRISCTSESELADDSKIKYLAQAITAIVEFHQKCLKLV